MKTTRVTIFSKAFSERKKREDEEKAADGFHFQYKDAIANPYPYNRSRFFIALKSGKMDTEVYLPETGKMHEAVITDYREEYIIAKLLNLPRELAPANCQWVAYIVRKARLRETDYLDLPEVWWYTGRDGRMMRDVVASINSGAPPFPIPDLGVAGPLVTAARRSKYKCRFQAGGDFVPMNNCIYVSNAYA